MSHLPGNQELNVVTAQNKMVVIEGLSLFTALCTARAQVRIALYFLRNSF